RRVVYDDIFVAADRRSRGIEGAGVDVGIELPAHREAAGLVAMEGRDFGVELVARGRGVDLELGADLGSGIVELLREQAVARALAGNRFPDDDIAAAVEGGDRRLALLADDVRVDGELAADRVAVDIEMLGADAPVADVANALARLGLPDGDVASVGEQRHGGVGP